MTRPLSISLFPIIPAWQIALLAVFLLALLALGCVLLSRKNVPRRWVSLLAVLRVMIVVVFVLGLLQPIVSYSRRVERRPEMLVLVDTSRSMALPAAEGAGSRLDEVLGALRAAPFQEHLQQNFQQEQFAFDRLARPLNTSDETPLQPTGETTDFAASITGALNDRRVASVLDPSAGGNPERLLLVSDGNDLGSNDVIEAARRAGIVIDTLAPATAPAAHASGVLLTDVQTSRRVLLGAELRFLVTLRNPGQIEGTRTLVLAEDGKDVERQPVSLAKDREELRVALAHRPLEAGLKHYELRLAEKADPAPPDKPATAYGLHVRVISDKHELLVLQDTWRWDFKFLRRILEDDPNFSMTAMLSRGGNAFVQFGEPDRRVNLAGPPQGRDELDWFDTIVLADVNPARWPRGLAAAIAGGVIDEGKSLVVMAGPNLGLMADVPELEVLLPVEITRAAGTPVDGPIDVQISQEGTRSSFFFQMPGAGQAGRSELPTLDQIYPVIRKRPAATVLVEAVRHTNGNGNLIVMAEHTVGRGRVLFIGTDTLWKWQTLGPQNDTHTTLYQVFWQQALRALAPARSDWNAVSLWLQPERSRYDSGQMVRLRAEVESERPLSQPRVQSTVLLPDGRQSPLAFTPDPVTPHLFVAEFEASASGPYRITASVRNEGKSVADTQAAVEVAAGRTELDERPVDRVAMAQIAAGTGGRVIVPTDPGSWPAADAQAPRMVAQRVTLDLWNNFSLLLVLCTLLGADWLLRLLRGYV